MNKEQMQRLHYLCQQLGPTANALIATLSLNTWQTYDSMIPESDGRFSKGFRLLKREENLTRILEVLEEAYKTIIEE